MKLYFFPETFSMQKLFLLITTALFSFTSHSQLNKGQWLVGGAAGFSYANNSNFNNPLSVSDKSSDLKLSPGGAYFFGDKFCAGILTSISSIHYNYTNNSVIQGGAIYAIYENSANTSLSVGPFARYYFLKKKNKVNLLADLGVAYNYNKLTNNSPTVFINGVALGNGANST